MVVDKAEMGLSPWKNGASLTANPIPPYRHV